MRERALETKILRLINRANREYHLINPGDRILVASREEKTPIV